jgi:hypothetical protein
LERKTDFFMSFLRNECSVVRVDLFLALMYPVELTSKQFRVHV